MTEPEEQIPCVVCGQPAVIQRVETVEWVGEDNWMRHNFVEGSKRAWCAQHEMPSITYMHDGGVRIKTAERWCMELCCADKVGRTALTPPVSIEIRPFRAEHD